MLNLPNKKEAVRHQMSPQSLIAVGFLAMIAVGTALLMLPIAAANGQPTLTFSEAAFTSTSATCVTGLSVIDVGTRLSLFGQLTLLALIQLGGLGITAFGTFFLVLIGRRLSMRSEFVLMDAYGMEKVNSLRGLLTWTVLLTVIIEILGAVSLYFHYRYPVAAFVGYPPVKAAYYAVFHSVSAFCNAGFSLHTDNLTPFRSDPWYLNTVSFLVIAGGLGFLVLFNLITIKFWRRNLKTRGRLSLNTKVVLCTTVVLVTLGGLAFLGLEWNHALRGMPISDKLVCAFFHSSASRTAGFNVFDLAITTECSRFVTILLMAIGGSPGSAAGGIKTSTCIVLLMTVISMCKNRQETVIFRRTVPASIVRESIVIALLAFAMIFAAYTILLFTEEPLSSGEPSRLLFEVVSASATVGMSVDTTTELSLAGRWVIIVCMFIGRIGPLATAFMIGSREEPSRIRYPEEEIVVG
jgi:trk system potassium uptake protein TrkH